MQKMKLFPLYILSALFVLLTQATWAQVPAQPDDHPRPGARGPNLMAALGLSPEQVQQIRQIRGEKRPQIQAAVRRLREANRALDIAVYADTVNETEVQARLAEYQAAQAEVARLRFQSELAIRRILTPDQLLRFRELRRQFAERRMDPANRGEAGPAGKRRPRFKPQRPAPNDF